MRLAPGLCQPITPSLFCACVCEWAVCSGLTDCFSVVGTLITAPTLSQASASLPPSFSPPVLRCSQLQACPALVRQGAGRERKDWKTRKETRHQVAQILEHGRQEEQTSQLELAVSAGSWRESRPLIRLRVSHLRTEIGMWPQFDPCPAGPSPQAPPRERGSFYSDKLHSPVCGG